MLPLSAADIRAAFDDLAQRLQRRGARADIYIAGGAAMVLAHGAARIADTDDARLLMDATGLRTVNDVDTLVGEVFPGETLPQRHRDWLQHIIRRAAWIEHEHPQPQPPGRRSRQTPQ